MKIDVGDVHVIIYETSQLYCAMKWLSRIANAKLENGKFYEDFEEN